MKQKLTKIETRAKKYCDLINEWNGTCFSMEWRKFATWGMIAVILDNHDEKCAEASGCGYDKESGCLAGFLRFLCPSVAGAGGDGLNAVKEKCENDGWILEKTASGKTFDAYRIDKM